MFLGVAVDVTSWNQDNTAFSLHLYDNPLTGQICDPPSAYGMQNPDTALKPDADAKVLLYTVGLLCAKRLCNLVTPPRPRVLPCLFPPQSLSSYPRSIPSWCTPICCVVSSVGLLRW